MANWIFNYDQEQWLRHEIKPLMDFSWEYDLSSAFTQLREFFYSQHPRWLRCDDRESRCKVITMLESSVESVLRWIVKEGVLGRAPHTGKPLAASIENVPPLFNSFERDLISNDPDLGRFDITLLMKIIVHYCPFYTDLEKYIECIRLLRNKTIHDRNKTSISFSTVVFIIFKLMDHARNRCEISEFRFMSWKTTTIQNLLEIMQKPHK